MGDARLLRHFDALLAAESVWLIGDAVRRESYRNALASEKVPHDAALRARYVCHDMASYQNAPVLSFEPYPDPTEGLDTEEVYELYCRASRGEDDEDVDDEYCDKIELTDGGTTTLQDITWQADGWMLQWSPPFG